MTTNFPVEGAGACESRGMWGVRPHLALIALASVLAFGIVSYVHFAAWRKSHPLLLVQAGWTPAALPNGRVCYLTIEELPDSLETNEPMLCVDSSGHEVWRTRTDIGDVPLAYDQSTQSVLFPSGGHLYGYSPHNRSGKRIRPIAQLPPEMCSALAVSSDGRWIAALCHGERKQIVPRTTQLRDLLANPKQLERIAQSLPPPRAAIWIRDRFSGGWTGVKVPPTIGIDGSGGLSWGPQRGWISFTGRIAARKKGGAPTRRIAAANISSGSTRFITRGPDDSNPAWSPDRRLLIYVTERGAQLAGPGGRAELLLREAERAQASWLLDGTGAIVERKRSGLWRVPIRTR